MKVIAKVENGKFLCEVSDHELRKYMKKFGDFGMRVGSNIDLTDGYNFAEDAIKAMEKTEEFISSNQEIIKTITKGIKITSSISKDNNEVLRKCKNLLIDLGYEGDLMSELKSF